MVVFPEHHRTLYRLETIDHLVGWLSSAIAKHWSITFSSDITKLLSCGDTNGPECLALTADGAVYWFGRAWSGGSFGQSTLQDAVLRPEGDGAELPQTASETLSSHSMGRARSSPLQRLPLPPITHLVAGPTIGAAISTTNQLYLFLTRPLNKQPHLNDLNAGAPIHSPPLRRSGHTSLACAALKVKVTAAGTRKLWMSLLATTTLSP